MVPATKPKSNFHLPSELSKAFELYRKEEFVLAKEAYEYILSIEPGNDAAKVGLKLCKQQLKPKTFNWKPLLLALIVAGFVLGIALYLTGSDPAVPSTQLPETAVANEEQSAWSTAKSKGTRESYLRYAKDYPNGHYAEQAKASILALQDKEADEQTKAAKAPQDFDPEYKMIFVESGTYYMGCTKEQGEKCSTKKMLAHQVTLDDFYIAQFELTQDQWFELMGTQPSSFDCKNCPVEKVSFADVQQFINKLNKQTGLEYRLPTEAEWEYAARGGKKAKSTVYAGGNKLFQVGNFCDSRCTLPWKDSSYDDDAGTSNVVGHYAPNELGLYDMSGNVWEWCSDWYAPYEAAHAINPSGPETGTDRVLRGGSWNSVARYCQVSGRFKHKPDSRHSYLGFRLAHSAR